MDHTKLNWSATDAEVNRVTIKRYKTDTPDTAKFPSKFQKYIVFASGS
ncbi:protein of unknown function [Streptococcus thermophilus]|uniref:Uncharacterized protein n=1 Tax=Streptococcus thermophilus TaxID=1308 RepID=A0AAU9H9F5_STRTR|nr:protein of unknown function [Streptococcus thermophilus]